MPAPRRLSLRKAWAERRGLVLAVLFAGLLTLVFAIRFWVHLGDWRAHEAEPLAGWMTLGYVARTQDVDRAALEAALGLEGVQVGRMSLASIATLQGRPLADVEADVEAALAAARDAP